MGDISRYYESPEDIRERLETYTSYVGFVEVGRPKRVRPLVYSIARKTILRIPRLWKLITIITDESPGRCGKPVRGACIHTYL